MRTFSIETLGCKVNQYEGEQIAELLRRRGLVQSDAASADLRIVHTCSVTTQAASKSRQSLRRMIRLPVLPATAAAPSEVRTQSSSRKSKVVATGCFATSNPQQAASLGVDAVITNQDDLAAKLDRLLDLWNLEPTRPSGSDAPIQNSVTLPKPLGDERFMMQAGASVQRLDDVSRPYLPSSVKPQTTHIGARSLPLLGSRQDLHQRALLKIQDGCDAHCTYCIIPRLRGRPWSKPFEQVIEEARRLVAAGHRELVLTGIFLGAYGQSTAIRGRQPAATVRPLGNLVSALCTGVPGLRRLRLSSLEPADLTPDLLEVLKSHPQCVPHFHLPLQSGSDAILRRMNRQYTRDDFLRMIERVHGAFDRPAITADIIVGFPGETHREFEQTLHVVDRAKFIHIHSFSFSPRPGTAAAKWSRDFVPAALIKQRIETLHEAARRHSIAFRKQFIGENVQVLVERSADVGATIRHGRCERYFDVAFACALEVTGQLLTVRVQRLTTSGAWGTVVQA